MWIKLSYDKKKKHTSSPIGLISSGDGGVAIARLSMGCDGLYVESAAGAVCSEDRAQALLQNRRSFV